MRFIILLIATLLTSSCSKQIKEKIGIETNGPNEYSVIKNRPLEIPPHYDLPSNANVEKENTKEQNE